MTAFQSRTHKDLCADCATIFASVEDANKLVSYETVHHERQYGSIQASQKEGCPLCDVVTDVIGSKPLRLVGEKLVVSWDEMQSGDGPDQPPESAVLSLDYRMYSQRYNNEKHTIEMKVDWKGFKWRNKPFYLEILADSDDPAAELLPSRSISLNVTDREVLSRIKQWLAECHGCHARCKECQFGELQDHIKPGYLLNLNCAEDQVSLEQVASSSKPVYYAALSYCWGGEQLQQTTSFNLASYQESIPTSSLPRTIRDAISLSKSLGLSYLWVDSMCIIQDSTVHKQEEIGRMGAIYHNAYVVISAASAATCEDGFLQERDLSPKYGSFRIPFGADGIAFLTPKLCTNKLPTKEENPLDKRAWAYQEMFIARRIVVFTSHGVTWNCVQTSGAMGHRAEGAGFEYREDTCRQPLENPELKTWCFIVEKFSYRNLTRDSDKLPALSSIARLFDHGRDSVYLAGIWIRGGRQLLTWGTAPQFDKTNAPSRPREWRAPSWSYLSINGPFGFSDLDGGQTSDEWKGMGWTAWDFQAELLDPNNPYGEVKSCSMAMKCRLMEVRVKEKGRQDTDRSYSLQLPGRSMAQEELKLEDEVKLSGEANTLSPDSPSVFQWSEIRPYIFAVMFDAVIRSFSSEPVQISSCYGPLPLEIPLWFFLMWHTNEWIKDASGPITTGWPKRSRELIYGYALVEREDGTFHRVGWVECLCNEGESIMDQVEKLPYREFKFV